MKYILLSFLTLPLPAFTQTIENPRTILEDKADNPSNKIEIEKETSESEQNGESKDNKSLTQAEIRQKKKLDVGFGYAEVNDDFSQ